MKPLLGFTLLCASVSAFATNGSHFIGISPASTAMGGTGVANYTNPIDALQKNPSLLGDASAGKGKVNAEASFLYIANNATSSAGAVARESTAAAKFSPAFAASYVADDKLSFGAGLLSFGGATVDQIGAVELNQLKTSLSLIKVVGAVAYKLSDKVAVSLAPTLYYSSLSVNHSFPVSSPVGVQTTRAPHATTGFGAQIGASAKPLSGLTVGLTYSSEANLTYKEIMDLDAFGPAAGAATAALDNIEAQQPAELGLGAGYEVTPDLTVTADYRFIQWGQANAFRELGWQSQHVLAFGAQYKMSALKLRAGFNYGKSPIQDATGEAGLTPPVNFQGHSVFQQSLTSLNLVAFPAVTETHVTFGAGYDVNKELALDLAVNLALKKTITRSGTGLNPNTGTPGAYTLSAQASQFSIGVGATYQL